MSRADDAPSDAWDAENWERVWSGAGERLFVERQTTDDYTRHRFRSNGPGDGAVVVARAGSATLFIQIARPVLGLRLLELPRGQAETDDQSALVTADRELNEETGWRLGSGVTLGKVWPDSGLSGDGVHVVLTHDPVPPEPHASAEFSVRWLEADEISHAVQAGEIRDAISLAALVVAGGAV